jgi:hypothetical protein
MQRGRSGDLAIGARSAVEVRNPAGYRTPPVTGESQSRLEPRRRGEGRHGSAQDCESMWHDGVLVRSCYADVALVADA